MYPRWACRAGLRGNYGFLDQRACLKWVRAEIGAFGGAGDNVTVWGQSAGAQSIYLHMASGGSKGLFHRAILESPVAGFQYQKADVQRAVFGRKFAKLAGCAHGNTTCLRALPARTAIGLGEQASGAVGAAIVDRVLEGGRIEDAWRGVEAFAASAEAQQQPLRCVHVARDAEVELMRTFVFAHRAPGPAAGVV